MNIAFWLSSHSCLGLWLPPHFGYCVLAKLLPTVVTNVWVSILGSIFHFTQISLAWLVQGNAQEVPQSPNDDLAHEFVFFFLIYFGKKDHLCSMYSQTNMFKVKGEYLLFISILLCSYSCS